MLTEAIVNLISGKYNYIVNNCRDIAEYTAWAIIHDEYADNPHEAKTFVLNSIESRTDAAITAIAAGGSSVFGFSFVAIVPARRGFPWLEAKKR